MIYERSPGELTQPVGINTATHNLQIKASSYCELHRERGIRVHILHVEYVTNDRSPHIDREGGIRWQCSDRIEGRNLRASVYITKQLELS